MIKSIVVHDIPFDSVPAMERWYHRDHSAEIARRYGPWLARHESYLPADAPAGARVSELWYETFTDWRRSVIESPPPYTRPSWSTCDAYPLVKPFEGLVSSFLLERPNDEFLRDLRSYTP